MTPARAIAIQLRMRGRVARRDRVGRVRRIAGIDISVRDGRARAAVVILDARTLAPLEARTAEMDVPFPYVPGLLSFREIPPILRAFRKLRARPDLAIVDGQGVAHPRRCGLASHLGVVLDLPTIGCAKSRLIGQYDEPADRRGAWSPLLDDGETIGAALRTQDGVNVVYVSTGHRVSLRTAVRWVLRTAARYRLPEPIRAADHEAGRWDHASHITNRVHERPPGFVICDL